MEGNDDEKILSERLKSLFIVILLQELESYDTDWLERMFKLDYVMCVFIHVSILYYSYFTAKIFTQNRTFFFYNVYPWNFSQSNNWNSLSI